MKIRHFLPYLLILPSTAVVILNSWTTLCQEGRILGNKTHLNFVFAPGKSVNSSTLEGLHFCVINQWNGKVIFYKKFAFKLYWMIWADFQRYLKSVANGRLVILHISSRSIEGLRKAKEILHHHGSSFSMYLTPKNTWTWIFVKGGKTVLEMKNEQCSFFEIKKVLSPVGPSMSDTPRRFELCQKYGTLWYLCDDRYLEMEKLRRTRRKINQSPVIIFTGNRHTYLLISILSFWKAGLDQLNDIVFILDVPCTPVIEILSFLGYNHTLIHKVKPHNYKFNSFRYYKNAFKKTLDVFQSSHSFIFLEEDIEVSPDFFSYMSQAASFLKEDSSLYCVTATSICQQGRAFNESRILRGSVQVGWGYALTSSFVKEIISMWPEESPEGTLFDTWIYVVARKTRECIFPEVPRSRHFGLGIHAHYWATEKYSHNSLLAQSSFINFDVKEMKKDIYDEDMIKTLQTSEAIETNPCEKNFSENLNAGNYVVSYLYDYKNKETHMNWVYLHACFGAWPWSTQGHHQWVSRIFVKPNATVYLVAVPQSPLGKFLNSSIPVWSYNSLSDPAWMALKDIMSAVSVP